MICPSMTRLANLDVDAIRGHSMLVVSKVSGVKGFTYMDPVEDRRSAELNLARMKSNMI